MQTQITKLSKDENFLAWVEETQPSTASLETHMKVCVYLENTNTHTKHIVDTYAAWVYATTQLCIEYNVIDRVDSDNTIRAYQSAKGWLDVQVRRDFLSKLEDIIIPRKRQVYNTYEVEEERRAKLRKVHGSLIVNLRVAKLGAAELG